MCGCGAIDGLFEVIWMDYPKVFDDFIGRGEKSILCCLCDERSCLLLFG